VMRLADTVFELIAPRCCDLQAGDFVGVCCGLDLSDHKDAIKPIHIRAYRMSKPPATSVRASVLVPQIEGQWWQVAGNPDLGDFTSSDQQPVDFAVWQAADRTWQLWSCIRKTNCGGNTRLFHGWEGRRLTDTDWKPLGVVMQAEAKFGESPGGLQAPHVIRRDDTYYIASLMPKLKGIQIARLKWVHEARD